MTVTAKEYVESLQQKYGQLCQQDSNAMTTTRWALSFISSKHELRSMSLYLRTWTVYCSSWRLKAMPDLVNNAFWYTVWDAKTGDLLASGTAAMCARRLGYASANSFAASVCHWLKDGRQHVKYICQREIIPRSEVDSLPRKPKRPARVRSTDEPKGDGFSTPHHPEE